MKMMEMSPEEVRSILPQYPENRIVDFLKTASGHGRFDLVEVVLDFQPEFQKIIVFNSYCLENSGNFLNFTKSSRLFGEFLSFLAFSRIYMYFCKFS